jgi:hypothetical protein
VSTDDDPPAGHDAAGAGERRFLADVLGRDVPTGFRRSVIRLAPGASVSCSDPSWRDALLVLGQGEIEVRTPSGSTGRFSTGAVIAVADIPLSVVHVVGLEPAVLAAVRQSRPPSGVDQMILVPVVEAVSPVEQS